MCDRFKLASWYISSLSLLLETLLGLQGAQWKCITDVYFDFPLL